MTTGYLWTGQFKEAQRVIDKGNPHSMELDEDTLDGKWSQNLKTGMDFFIINDAIFSKLCILGEDIEPCFEGSSVTAPQVSASFTKVDDDFKKTLYSMMQELKFALEGGQKMALEKIDKVSGTNFSAEEDKNKKDATVENQKFTEEQSNQNNVDFVATDGKEEEEEDKKKEDSSNSDTKTDETKKSNEEDKKKEEYACGEDEDKKKDYALLEQKYNDLEQKYSDLETNYQALIDFKNQVENEKKDELINSFYMLSDEDKKDVVENKAKYSLEDIEAKLSVICVRKKVNFDLEDTSKNKNKVEEKPVTTFNLEEQNSSVPAWISALKNTRDSKNN